jgi:hypothetical protein
MFTFAFVYTTIMKTVEQKRDVCVKGKKRKRKRKKAKVF